MWKNLVNFILRLFGKANDWVKVWEDYGTWQVPDKHSSNLITEIPCSYLIQFSESLKAYRLIQSGHKPESHTMLLVANMQLIKFKKDLIFK